MPEQHGPATPPPHRHPPPPFAFALPPGSPEWPGKHARMGSESPRSKVAHHFRALDLDGPADATCGSGALPRQPPAGAPAGASPPLETRSGKVDGADRDAVMEDAQLTIRERQMDAPETTPPTAPQEDTDKTPPAPPKPKRPLKKRKAPTAKRTARAKRTKKKKPPADASPEREVVDPLRASLTWQEDEITVYDPEDADDDGEGMNGVGFQPAPGAARVTARRKMGQLAEYRRMVEREAREGRRRRRGGRGGEERVSRVRFLEGETVIEVL